jgi:hypothetical protein
MIDIDVSLSTQLAATHLESPTEEAQYDAPKMTPDSPPANVQLVHECIEDECASHFANYAPSKDTHHQRVDSHQEGEDSIRFFKSQLAQLREDSRQATSELQKAKKEINQLRRQVESQKVRSDLQDEIDELRVQVENYKARWIEELSKSKDGVEREMALRTELVQCQNKIESLDRLDSVDEMVLDGRISRIPDDVCFKKLYNSDLSTEVVLSRKFLFPKKEWCEWGSNYEGHDDAAIGVLKLGGRIYTAKAGRTRSDVGDFVNSDHWTTEAMELAKSVDHTTYRRYATHVEPQLMAFYITRTLRDSGHQLVDFGDYSKHPVLESNAELRPIQISVSQRICGRCTNFTTKVNEFAKNYGYRFEPIDTS